MNTKNFVTPKGELIWIFIDGEGREDLNGVPKYQATLRCKKDSPADKEMAKTIADFWNENKPKGKKMKSNGTKSEWNKETDEATGYNLYNFWTQVSFPSGDKKVVKVFNAKATEIDLRGKKIGNGSEGFISGAMGIYDRPEGAGVTLYLNAVQLTKFVEYQGGITLAKAEEGGWTGEELNKEGFAPAEEANL